MVSGEPHQPDWPTWRRDAKAWSRTGVRQRTQVHRLAKEGRQHPDPRVAAAAADWAAGASVHGTRRIATFAAAVVLIVIISAAIDADPVGWLFGGLGVAIGMWINYGPRAKRILAATSD